MINILPSLSIHLPLCPCGGGLLATTSNILWQGPHTCVKAVCESCGTTYYADLPVGQGKATPFLFDVKKGSVVGVSNWYSSMLSGFAQPNTAEVRVDVQKFSHADEVVVLNTIDMCYGHSILFLFNLQNIIQQAPGTKVVVLVQPMLRWLVPKHDAIAEVWVIHLSFKQALEYFPSVSQQVNEQLRRFTKVGLSAAHLLPKHIAIEQFTGIAPYNFNHKPAKPRITFIWRADGGRQWVKSRHLRHGFTKAGLTSILTTVQVLRIVTFFRLLKRRLGSNYSYTVAGVGNARKLPAWIDDQRISFMNEEREVTLCKVYAESLLVVGVHGSSMILPTAHSSMAVSLMPSKRWGNFMEDIMVKDEDARLSAFQQRVLPMQMPLREIVDICVDMIVGRSTFVKKFMYAEEDL